MTIKRIKIASSGADAVSTEMQKLGVSDYETRVYVELVQTNSATDFSRSETLCPQKMNC